MWRSHDTSGFQLVKIWATNLREPQNRVCRRSGPSTGDLVGGDGASFFSSRTSSLKPRSSNLAGTTRRLFRMSSVSVRLSNYARRQHARLQDFLSIHGGVPAVDTAAGQIDHDIAAVNLALQE
jgi:hypothetical protein